MPIRRHLTYANIAATLALVFSMSAGAMAASHYVITSTHQIKPNVIRALRGTTGPPGPQGLQGPQGVAGAKGSEANLQQLCTAITFAALNAEGFTANKTLAEARTSIRESLEWVEHNGC
jgi:hypothetical protein